MYAKQERERLRRKIHIYGKNRILRHKQRRFIITNVREQINKSRKTNKRLDFSDVLFLLRKKRSSPILNRLCPSRDVGGWLPPAARKPTKSVVSIDLENFSLLHNPEKMMSGLMNIIQIECEVRAARLNFKDEYCLDVASFMILVEIWDKLLPVFQGGTMSIPIQKVISAVGLQDALSIGLGGVSNHSNVWAFPLQRRRPTGTSSSPHILLDSQKREMVADRFCDALDQWLSQPEINCEINQQGRSYIKIVFGEILENAERHSDGLRRDGDWSVCGFMARRVNASGDYIYHAQLGILNLGDTIASSLVRAGDPVKAQVAEYIAGVRRAGCRLSDETLSTVVALQDGITSVVEADEAGRGGFGLQEMLELVDALGRTSDSALLPRVTILSGQACIMLREPYLRGIRSGRDKPRVLWFNPDNLASVPPDEAYVFDLLPGLPGTVISMGFVLDPANFDDVPT